MTTTASLTLTLGREAQGAQFVLRHLDFERGELRHRLSISGDRAARDVLHEALADAVEVALAQLDQAQPGTADELLCLPGLVLGQMAVAASQICLAGGQAITIRFRCAVGCFQCALADGTGFGLAPSSLREEIETRLLADVATPVLTLLAGLDETRVPDGAVRTVEARLDRLAQDRNELLFYLDLLKRYAQNAALRDQHLAQLCDDKSPPAPRDVFCNAGGCVGRCPL